MDIIAIFFNYLRKIGLSRLMQDVSSRMLTVSLGIIAGLAGSIFEGFSSGAARGAVLGGFMSLGVLIIRVAAPKEIDLKVFPAIWKILTVAFFMGILAGLTGYYAVFREVVSVKTDFGIVIPTYRFSLPVFMALTMLYPFILLPIHFLGNIAGLGVAIVLSLFGGACVSVIIEYCSLNNFHEALSYSILKGAPFAATWTAFMSFARFFERQTSE